MSDQISRRKFIGAAAALGAVAASAGLAGCASGSEAKAAKPVILVTSFGTSFANSRHITIGAVEDDIREAYPDYDVRRAFTAQIIIDHIEKDTGRHINNFEEAIAKCVEDGVKELIVQPTHLTAGAEYNDIKKALEENKSKFEKTALGEPLLTSDDDYKKVLEAVTAAMKQYEADDTAIVLMGHGNEGSPAETYDKFQKMLDDAGKKNYIVTTVEQEPGFEDAVKAVKKGEYKKAVLRPFMVVAGDHANNDMADASDKESLAGMLEAEGVEVTSVIEGLGQIVDIDEIYVEHVKAAIDSLGK